MNQYRNRLHKKVLRNCLNIWEKNELIFTSCHVPKQTKQTVSSSMFKKNQINDNNNNNNKKNTGNSLAEFGLEMTVL